ncbi:hypothetical protein FNF27_00689 [Cafeteria roenbergensis]|nr:hypothetical protein FNF29_00003 [Cafeteria roenbergensis]KAA0158354.1 hypothetical protein FNF31_05424 [Cafeteria roenbergensis]KAA0166187.1 hypothetical protein FNF28_03234 [Cafeteria roenbergensis]KAA0178141.1 hypothetical protein FNF27_00689 [Cafeteria roenbergensis]|eukprot:KAA0157427.1 hypothetical protein FNF29_00003 [Cafeteria roenbergensis]
MFANATRAAVRAARVAPRRLAHSEAAAPVDPNAKKVLGFITPHPSYTGAEAVLRGLLPHNWQVVIAVLGTYGVIATIATSGAPPAPPAPEKPDLKTEAVISEVPTLSENPEAWATFMEEEENVVKYFDSLNEE